MYNRGFVAESGYTYIRRKALERRIEKSNYRNHSNYDNNSSCITVNINYDYDNHEQSKIIDSEVNNNVNTNYNSKSIDIIPMVFPLIYF